jgi:hypothetical protein
MVVVMAAVAAAWITVTAVTAQMERLELSGVPEDHSHPQILEMFKSKNHCCEITR